MGGFFFRESGDSDGDTLTRMRSHSEYGGKRNSNGEVKGNQWVCFVLSEQSDRSSLAQMTWVNDAYLFDAEDF